MASKTDEFRNKSDEESKIIKDYLDAKKIGQEYARPQFENSLVLSLSR